MLEVLRRCGFGAATAAALLLAAPAFAGRSAGDYSYAGAETASPARGVAATIAAVRPPQVDAGHVAGWVGVDGRAPDGQFAWLQIGLSARPGETAGEIYVEVARAGRDPRYTVLRSGVAIGERHRLAVLAVRGRPGWWRAWLDGRPATAPVQLTGSEAGWKAEVTAESWNDGTGACNAFAYAFRSVTVDPVNDGRLPAAVEIFHDPGTAFAGSRRAGFVASSACS